MPAFRIFLGIAEWLGAAGLILPGATRIQPRLTTFAAVGLTIIVASASVLHTTRDETSRAITTAVLFFLLLSAVGMALVSVYDVSHPLHGLAAALSMPALPIAAPLITASLLRNPAWASSRRLLWWTANLPWISFALMLATVFIGLSQGGQFAVDIYVGWPNRLLIAAYCLWTATVAWCAGRVQEG